MRIVDIHREFGSKERKLGKYIARLLGYDYYSCENITAIAVLL